MLGITQHLHIDRYILTDFRIINIEMNDLRLLSVGLQITRHAVIETHTNRNQHIAFIGLAVRAHITMHT